MFDSGFTSQWRQLPSWKLTYPLKIDGWKSKFPVKMVPFQGTVVHFWGSVNLFFVIWDLSLVFQEKLLAIGIYRTVPAPKSCPYLLVLAELRW